jgi:hypothetical protein
MLSSSDDVESTGSFLRRPLVRKAEGLYTPDPLPIMLKVRVNYIALF